MRPLAEVGGVRYGLVDGPDVPAMVHMLADAFSKHDPPAIALGLSAADVEKIVQILAEKALDEDVTVVAESDVGELIGAMLTEDFGTPPPELSAAPPGFAALGALLDQLENEYRGMYSVSPGTDLHLFMVGVSERFGGRGVAQKMVELCIENGARRGYRRAFAETTGRTSQHIFQKAGFHERSRVSYGDFRYEERRVFASIAGEGGTLLMVRSLV